MFFQALGIATGAGVASALLFAPTAKGTLFAALLTGLTPLPIMACALGYTHWAGLLAAALGAFLLSVVFPSNLAIVFFIAVGLPAWWLARLATRLGFDADGRVRWTPLPALAMWAVGLSCALAIGWAMTLAQTANWDFEAAVAQIAQKYAPHIEAMIGPANLPKGVTALDIAAAILRATPIAVAGSTILMLLGNLWLAGRVAAISGLLARPLPDAPAEFGLPKAALGMLAAGLVIAFLDGLIGLFGWIAAAAAFTGFTLQGLASAHYLTRAWPQRRTALLALYVVLIVISWSGALIGLFGVADALFGLRARNSSPASKS
jgi:hypothetical protein